MKAKWRRPDFQQETEKGRRPKQ